MKGVFVALALLTMPVCAARFAVPVPCQQAGQDTGPAMPDPTLIQPPKEVTAKMRPKGITVRWERVRFGDERYWLHVYVVPTARNKFGPMQPEPGHEKDPITRKDIFAGAALESSPFYVELYADTANGGVTHLHQNVFTNEADVQSVAVRYLRPKERKGPLLLLEGGFTHWKQWTLIGYPDGARGKASFAQVFLWGGEGDYYTEQTFTNTDKRGFLQVIEARSEDGGKHEKKLVYQWNGQRFVDTTASYFVIGAATPTRAECEEYVRNKHREGEAEILKSDAFPKLKPGLFIVVVERVRTQKEAQEQVKLWKQRGLETYAKRAF